MKYILLVYILFSYPSREKDDHYSLLFSQECLRARGDEGTLRSTLRDLHTAASFLNGQASLHCDRVADIMEREWEKAGRTRECTIERVEGQHLCRKKHLIASVLYKGQTILCLFINCLSLQNGSLLTLAPKRGESSTCMPDTLLQSIRQGVSLRHVRIIRM